MLTACQKIKFDILSHAYKHIDNLEKTLNIKLKEINENNIDFVYSNLDEFDCDYVREAENEFRQGTYKTDIMPWYSRHYESDSVARQLSDGSYVGWTYYYGEGKPEEVAWMEHAYNLSVEEKEVVRTERTFTKINQKD